MGALNAFMEEDSMANNVIFKVGTKAVYDVLQQKDANTLYWLTM